jgi:RHS repeat-associated protein
VSFNTVRDYSDKKSPLDGNRTIYIGGGYEVSKDADDNVISTISYYPAAGAMRIQVGWINQVYYILGDQLGSTSVVVDANGAVVSTQGYYPYGETRYSTNTIITDRLFTGQQAIAGLGLYNYKARMYSPYITHFIQPDTIVPDLYNPQSLNRYSYAFNNPINYNDPTGHWPEWMYSVMGAVSQYMDDMSLGLFSYVVGDLGNIDSTAYQEGRSAGRAVAIVVASAEEVLGAAAVAMALVSIGPTTGGGTACALATGGICSIPAGVALAGEAAMAGLGVSSAGIGALQAYKINNDPLNNKGNRQSSTNPSQPVHGNSLNSTKKTTLYELLSNNGDHLKYGITSQSNPLDRYSRSFMQDKRMKFISQGTRRDMYYLENKMILGNPRGTLQFNNH